MANSPPTTANFSSAMELVRVLSIGLLSWFVIDFAGILMILVGSTAAHLVPLAAVGQAAIYAKLCLLGIWLAWGQSSVLWRSIIVLLVVAPIAFAFPAICLVVIAAALGGSIFRMFGYYRINIFELSESTTFDAQMAGRFRIVDLFSWTAMAAICASAARWLTPNVDAMQVAAFGAFACIAAVISPLAIWSTLTMHSPVTGRILIALATSVPLGGLLALGLVAIELVAIPWIAAGWTTGLWRTIFASMMALPLTMAALIGLLTFVIRQDGVRFVRRGQCRTSLAMAPATILPTKTKSPQVSPRA